MSPGDLGRILCGLKFPTDPNLLVGSETCDDAGVYKLNDTTALIQTLDFFTPIVDDSYQFGQIAAANALSDVYAMGGRPLLCMNILACPVNKMADHVFRDVIEGGLNIIKEAGALLVGGHTIEDEELKYGLSVTGLVHPGKVLLNQGAQPGDVLLLTKPLGIGILATAIKGGLTDDKTEKMLASTMATLNRHAGDSLRQLMDSEKYTHSIHACTDITGFGLIGHLHEMTIASGVAARIQTVQLPVLSGTYDFTDMGIIPAGAYTNQKFYSQHVNAAEDIGSSEMVVYDPQTSGGLLISLQPNAAEKVIQHLKESGYSLPVAIIGEVIEGKAGHIILE